MSFKDRPFAERMGALGDEAETVFELVYEQGFVRYGLNRPPIHVPSLPPFVRYTPDYLTAKGFVEVQGFGKDLTAKFKEDKLQALSSWGKHFRVDFFLWDNQSRRFGWLRLPDLMNSIHLSDVRQFPEGHVYFALPAERLPVVGWVPLGDRLKTAR